MGTRNPVDSSRYYPNGQKVRIEFNQMSAEDNEWLDAAVKLKSKVFEVFTNTDRTEGRGRKEILGYAKNKAAAKYLAKGQGIMGSLANIHEVDVIEIIFHDQEGNEQTLLVSQPWYEETATGPRPKVLVKIQSFLNELSPEEKEAIPKDLDKYLAW